MTVGLCNFKYFVYRSYGPRVKDVGTVQCSRSANRSIALPRIVAVAVHSEGIIFSKHVVLKHAHMFIFTTSYFTSWEDMCLDKALRTTVLRKGSRKHIILSRCRDAIGILIVLLKDQPRI